MFFHTVLNPYEREKENLMIINGLNGKIEKRSDPDRRFFIGKECKSRDKMKKWFLKNGFREIDLKEVMYEKHPKV